MLLYGFSLLHLSYFVSPLSLFLPSPGILFITPPSFFYWFGSNMLAFVALVDTLEVTTCILNLLKSTLIHILIFLFFPPKYKAIKKFNSVWGHRNVSNRQPSGAQDSAEPPEPLRPRWWTIPPGLTNILRPVLQPDSLPTQGFFSLLSFPVLETCSVA